MALVANNVTPVNLEDGKASISMEIADLEAIEKIILNEGLTYDELALKYPELVANANIASESEEDGIFDKSSDSPLGIPGFWWGFCLGWVGMLVVYLTMDSGSDRKEQVMNALWGCIISSVIGTIFYLAVIAATIF
jgi:hypothetical protein